MAKGKKRIPLIPRKEKGLSRVRKASTARTRKAPTRRLPSGISRISPLGASSTVTGLPTPTSRITTGLPPSTYRVSTGLSPQAFFKEAMQAGKIGKTSKEAATLLAEQKTWWGKTKGLVGVGVSKGKAGVASLAVKGKASKVISGIGISTGALMVSMYVNKWMSDKTDRTLADLGLKLQDKALEVSQLQQEKNIAQANLSNTRAAYLNTLSPGAPIAPVAPSGGYGVEGGSGRGVIPGETMIGGGGGGASGYPPPY